MRLPYSHEEPAVALLLEEICAGLRGILREGLLGIYVYGSLVTGDFDSGISDVDLVAVLISELDDARFAALQRLHERILGRHPQWENRIEIAYISSGGLRDFRQRSSSIGIISPGEPFHRVRAGRDWLISWRALREDGIALHGSDITTWLAPIGRTEYLQAVRAHIEGYRSLVQHTQSAAGLSYIVLTVARGVYTLQHGEPISKRKAATWAARTYQQWAALLGQALAWRAHPSAGDAAAVQPQVARYVDYMLARLPSGADSRRPV